MAKHKVLGRREFLALSALTTGTVALLSCAPTPPATPTKAPVAAAPAAPTPAPTRVAEPTKPPAAAPTPTTAPVAAAPTKAPAVAAAPTKAPAAATPAEKIGKALIGKLEGPEIVTDPAKYPRDLKEPPMLAELVKAGKLPPVKERIGEDPLVIKPLQEIGKYGGTWRLGFTGPGDYWNGVRSAGSDSVLFFDYTGKKVVPNVARGWEVSDGGRTITLNLRRGMKWSDGQPFTADDFVFWYQDMDQNKELNPIPRVELTINGKPGVVEKADTYTVRFKFPDPYYLLPDVLAATSYLGGHSLRGRERSGVYAPAHYLKQFHPKYVAKEELDKKVKEAKFDNWVQLFVFKNSVALNPECPSLLAWITRTPNNTPVWTLERNPYSIWADTEGNQLPYIDKIVMTLAENLEVVNLRAVAGEYDFQARHLEIAKVPVFLENQAKGGYKLYLDPGDFGSDAGLRINLSYEKDPEIAKWLGNPDFRRALALGIERNQLNETFWLGTGTPGSQAPEESNQFSPGPEWRTKWHTYDPKTANEMLDKIGLDKKDAEGFRLRSDGKGRLRIEVTTLAGMFVQHTQIGEMVAEQLKKIGVQLDVKEVERTLGETQVVANEHQVRFGHNDDTGHILLALGFVPTEGGSQSIQGPAYGKWYSSGGKEGKEPPPRVREVMDLWRKAPGLPDEERIKAGKEMWKIVLDDVWTPATVGQSAASQGIRVAKINLGNVPARLYNSQRSRNPAITRTMTLFWKS